VVAMVVEGETERMKSILIKRVPSLKVRPNSRPTPGWSMKEFYQASLAFVISPTHFICVKNRWGSPLIDGELIPNYLLCDYIRKYEEHYTKRELIETLIACS
jgi:hypothetical protein